MFEVGFRPSWQGTFSYGFRRGKGTFLYGFRRGKERFLMVSVVGFFYGFGRGKERFFLWFPSLVF